ncbi:beta-CASP ribonuclease aCPSF1 [archaeon]|nr:beta-CASP ribonuclease aCPSF1 [archaeon]|tara:strand:- start:1983 stop:3863 length:1881 start_codon:yes stop_codon:yes gene_type:complete
MIKILEEILKDIPNKNLINDIEFEGANIVLYTKDKEFFLDDKGIVKEIVNKIKKRIELRPDPSITMDMEKAEDVIKKIIGKDAKAGNIIFDYQRAVVIIEAEKPGLVIGKYGELLKEIKKQTLWVPIIRRTPAIRSKIIENIRQVLYENNDYRKKFLNKVGERIYKKWVKEKQYEWIRVTFLGGAREVGRSCLLLQTPESKILLDCGVNVASDDNAYPILDAPEFNIQDLDAVIISHAHLDHSGCLPYLFKMGYKGPVYCTAPTRDIMSLLHLDFISVAQKEAKKALFSSTDVKEMVKHTICLDYEEVTDITPDVRITLYNAGHTLGSSMVHLHVGNGLHNILYTGDMKELSTRLLEPAAVKFPRLETCILESTYGGKDNVLPSRKECEDQLMNTIKETIERKGKVLIPVLGVGRSQEIMVILEDMIKNGKLKDVPIYIDGMVWDITAIHTTYPDFLHNKIRKNIFHNDQNPFLSDVFTRVGSHKERMEVVDGKPCVVLATSGMLVGGASVEYLKHFAENKKNSLIFVSYQGVGSLGNKIQRGDKEVKIDNDMVSVNLDISILDGFTGHADRSELMRFVQRLDPKPKKVIVDHGESSRCLDLASSLHKANRIETNAPKNLESIRVR